MSTPIKFEDIREGDTIKTLLQMDDVFIERSGKVSHCTNTSIRTEGNGYLWHEGWEGKPAFELLDRPKPQLPTKPGTIILAETTLEKIHLILRDGNWWYLDGSSFYHVNSIRNRPWKLLKLVDA